MVTEQQVPAPLRPLCAGLVGLLQLWPAARLGLYLHGSWARGEAGPGSDVDVLGLADASAEREDLRAFACAARRIDALQVDVLDVKAFPWPAIAEDPWVPLERAVFLGGDDWRTIMPTPTLDQRAREALVVIAVHVEEDTARAAESTQSLTKVTGWLASALAGHSIGIAPRSGREAVDLLKDHGDPAGDRIDALMTDLSSARSDLVTAREKVRKLQDDVVAVLINQLEAGLLGARASEQVVRLARAYERDLGTEPSDDSTSPSR